MFPGGIGEEPNDGDYPNGGHGPVNTTIGADNVPCLTGMYPGAPTGPGVHMHAFVGIYYNGKEVALPDGLGFSDPAGDYTYKGIPNWTNYNTTSDGCIYEMHTHDASGMIHIESYTAPTGGIKGTKYSLGDFLAEWGIPTSSTNWGPLNGTVTIYTSGPVYRGHQAYTYSNTYSLYCSACDPALVSMIPLYSHEVIWVLVGTGNLTGSSLPNVDFYTEY